MNSKQEQVILLHGMSRSPRSMAKIAKILENQGYRVYNLGYNSLLNNYQQILDSLNEKIEQWLIPDNKVHFVGHSLGGIFIRGLLAKNNDWNTGRCVMLGTPNKGTQTASFMLSQWWSKYFVPKITADLKPDSELLKNLPEPSIETGIIAGDVSHHILIPISWYYKKATDNAPGDGVVELINTQCDDMTDFIILPVHHSFMIWDNELLKQVVHFIRNGKFTADYVKENTAND